MHRVHGRPSIARSFPYGIDFVVRMLMVLLGREVGKSGLSNLRSYIDRWSRSPFPAGIDREIFAKPRSTLG